MIKIKHSLASAKDKKPTISKFEMSKLIKNKDQNEVTIFYPDHYESVTYKKTRKGETWYPISNWPNKMHLPIIGLPIYLNVKIPFTDIKDNTSIEKHEKQKSLKLKNEFDPIRKWAKERGLYKKGDVKTQFIKLSEEVGELAQGILKSKNEEIEDAIGDIVVVLTNLAELHGTKIETCINNAYKEIVNRKGKMENGTFIKNK